MADVKAGKIAPTYLITGEEGYYIDVLSDFFENEVIPKENRDFDQTVIYGRDTNMQDVISCAKRYPVMSEYQLVLVKEAQTLSGNWDLLEGYLKNPSEKTILVFCYRDKDFSKKSKKAHAAIKKQGIYYERKKLYESEVPTWISTYAQRNKRTITEKASILTVEAVGTDLSKIANELNKLFISIPEGAVINDEAIEHNIGISKDFNVFELKKAIISKDVVKCNRIINYFAHNPKAGPMTYIVGNLYDFFVKTMIYIQLPDQSQYNAASVLGINPYFVKEHADAARNYSLQKLALCIRYLLEAEKKSKGFNNFSPDGEILKELIFKIIH